MNNMYPSAMTALWRGELNWEADTIKVFAIDTDLYDYDRDAEFLSDLPQYCRLRNATIPGRLVGWGGSLICDPVELVGVSINNDADDVKGLVVYKDTGDPATSPLICWIDQFEALEVNGGNVSVTWGGFIAQLATDEP